MFISEKVKEIREKQGISKNQLSKRCGCSATLINHIEGSKRKDPQLSTLLKISKGLGISISELVEGIELEK